MNKILRYLRFKNVTKNYEHRFVIRYHFTLIDESKVDSPEEENVTQNIFIDVEISELKAASWNLIDESSISNLIKVLFEYGKRELIEKIQDATIEKNNILHIYTNTHPEKICPFNPNKINMIKGQEFKISVPNKTLNQRIAEDNIAFSIITKRDEINALFKQNYKDKLLIVTQERNLLELFRSAETVEDFSYRVTSLGNLVGSLNKKMLLKETNLDSSISSIRMLESLLNGISQDQGITKIFKNLNSLRHGYPVHGDNIEGVIEAYKYFELEYPIQDFNKSWNKLKDKYCHALKELFLIAKSFER